MKSDRIFTVELTKNCEIWFTNWNGTFTLAQLNETGLKFVQAFEIEEQTTQFKKVIAIFSDELEGTANGTK